MKKILFVIAIVLTIGLTAGAQGRDAFFSRNYVNDDTYRTYTDFDEFNLPVQHNLDTDTGVPVGSGLCVLTILGAGYVVARRRKK